LEPETKKAIRGECHVGGWTLEPLPEDKNKTRLTLMIELDLKGGLSPWILKKANCDQAFQINRLRPVLADFCKQNNIKF